jgi:23S rRNA (cytidine1920-2'-O)/16S rRNA (cytidine1409-2'-O)-methyltransferase
MTRRRLDVELVRRGLVHDGTEAVEAVQAGRVVVGGVVATSAATMVGADAPVHLTTETPGPRFVSRAGAKLRAGLDRAEIDPTGAACLDAGASTGGFTDVLLRAGAAKVTAVDVAYGQLAWSLRQDPRVEVRERTNVRDLRSGDLEPRPALVVADLSFRALAPAIPALGGVAADDAAFVLLVKPQFEAPASDVEPGGLVRDPDVWRRALDDVIAALASAGVGVTGAMASPLRGPAGTVEFLVWGRRGGPHRPPDLDAVLDEGARVP